MQLQDFPLFADENIFQGTVQFLRAEGFNVRFVREEGLEGRKDMELIAIATAEGRVIITQDHDFGQIVFTQSIDFIGILHLRPGHFPPHVHVKTLRSLLAQDLDLQPPFFIVAENKNDAVRIKIRNLKPGPSKPA